jgi:hypothetical protein
MPENAIMLHEFLHYQDLNQLPCPASPVGFFSVSTINDIKAILVAREKIGLADKFAYCLADYFVWDTIPRENNSISRFGGNESFYLHQDGHTSKWSHLVSINYCDSLDLLSDGESSLQKNTIVQLFVSRGTKTGCGLQFLFLHGGNVIPRNEKTRGAVCLPELWATRVRIPIYPQVSLTEELCNAFTSCNILVPQGCFITGRRELCKVLSNDANLHSDIIAFSGVDVDIFQMHSANGLNRFGPYAGSLSFEQLDLMEIEGASLKVRGILGESLCDHANAFWVEYD